MTDVNQRIREASLSTLHGPPSTVMPLDEEETVRTWHKRRAAEG